MTESTHFEVYKEYETAILKVKETGKVITIGDFYGDVEKVIISPQESYCIMIGCGIIVYFLKEPFIPYEYEKKTEQWQEWYREGNIWIEDVMIVDESGFVIQMENGKKEALQISA